MIGEHRLVYFSLRLSLSSTGVTLPLQMFRVVHMFLFPHTIPSSSFTYVHHVTLVLRYWVHYSYCILGVSLILRHRDKEFFQYLVWFHGFCNSMSTVGSSYIGYCHPCLGLCISFSIPLFLLPYCYPVTFFSPIWGPMWVSKSDWGLIYVFYFFHLVIWVFHNFVWPLIVSIHFQTDTLHIYDAIEPLRTYYCVLSNTIILKYMLHYSIHSWQRCRYFCCL